MLWFSGKSNGKAEEAQRTDHPEQGSALVEFIGLGALLMVPTVYFLLSVFSMQSAAFAASNASAHALQVIQFLPPEQRNQSAVQAIAALTASDFGLGAETITATLSCEDVCAASERMTVNVTVEVGLPLVPWPGAPTLATMTSQAVSWGGDYS